jgi:aspartate racemase
MKIVGLIGGMSWESSLEYYRIMNRLVREKLGGQHSARILMFSVDFHELEEYMRLDRWDEITAVLADAARRLEKGKADLLIICTNTMHKVAPEVEKEVSVPLLHIADATGEDVIERGISVVGLLGTRYTMEQDFLKGYLSSKYGLEVRIPDLESREIVHRVIFEELCLGETRESSKNEFKRIIEEMSADGCQGVILGCTEIPLLIRSTDVSIPLFDTTAIHARKAVEWALKGILH